MKFDWIRTDHNPTHPDSTGHHVPRLLPPECAISITEFGGDRQHFLAVMRQLEGITGSLQIQLWHRNAAWLRSVAEVIVDDDLLPYLGDMLKNPQAAAVVAPVADAARTTQLLAADPVLP